MNEILTVDTAAAEDADGKVWTLPRPKRHDHVTKHARQEGSIGGFLKGFVLSDGSFIDREGAEAVARKSGQKQGRLIHPHLGGLSSDDLW